MAEEQPQATLRETLIDSIAQHTEPETPEVAAPAETIEAEPKPGRTAGRARDEAGKLLPGKAVKDATPAAEVAAAPSKEGGVQQAVADLPKPPSSWKKELWPVWEALHKGTITPEQAKSLVEYIPQRETQFATGVSTYKNIADSAKPLLDAVAPFQADLDRHHIRADEMVGKLMHAHRSLSLGSPQEKLHLFSRLAQDYGIPIQALYDQNAQQQYLATPHTPQPQAQPNIEKLIEQTLANREVQQTIGSMEKDQEKYPFFAYVRPTMAQLLETGEATDLNDAYLKALERPEHATLVSLSQQQQEQADAKRKSEAAQVAARVARSNTVSTKSATPAGAAVKGTGSVREALTAAVEQHRGGAHV